MGSLTNTCFDVFEDGKKLDNSGDYPEDAVESFAGKLLLIQGMKTKMTAGNMFLLVEELQRSNKDFDMLCMPEVHHAIVSYTMRREWDYLVKNLLGIDPPPGFKLKKGYEYALERFAPES